MANSLGMNIRGFVAYMHPNDFILPKHHPIRIQGGPGAYADNAGIEFVGECLCDRSVVSYSGMEIDRLLTAEELSWWLQREGLSDR